MLQFPATTTGQGIGKNEDTHEILIHGFPCAVDSRGVVPSEEHGPKVVSASSDAGLHPERDTYVFKPCQTVL